MKEHLNSYCKGCDQFSAPHRRRDDGQWVCEDCGHLVECSDPQWSDNCDGDLTTPHEVTKGLCEGCMAVIDSWSDDGGGDGGAEQRKLVTDGGVIDAQYTDTEHATHHECSESAADVVLLSPGDECPFCNEIVTGHSPPNLKEGDTVTGYFDPEIVIPVDSHTTREVAVVRGDSEDYEVMYECRDCYLVSNSVTRFTQSGCTGGDSDA